MAHRTQSTHTAFPAFLGDWVCTSEPISTETLYEITFKGDYVEVRHLKSFELTASVSEAIWDEALALCRAHNCKSILRIGPPPIRDMDPAEVVAVGSRLDIPGLKVAYCWDDYRPDRIAALFATQAMENEVTVRYFCSTEAAVKWLAED